VEGHVHGNVPAVKTKLHRGRSLEVTQDALCRFPMATFRIHAEAAEEANRVRDVWPCSQHGVHEGTDRGVGYVYVVDIHLQVCGTVSE
jgi:hypothetical protein